MEGAGQCIVNKWYEIIVCFDDGVQVKSSHVAKGSFEPINSSNSEYRQKDKAGFELSSYPKENAPHMATKVYDNWSLKRQLFNKLEQR